jgi:hypothetical protein
MFLPSTYKYGNACSSSILIPAVRTDKGLPHTFRHTYVKLLLGIRPYAAVEHISNSFGRQSSFLCELMATSRFKSSPIVMDSSSLGASKDPGGTDAGK